MIDFLNTNSGAIQAIMVIVLVSVTIWYAQSTKDMATLMHKEYKLHTRPFLLTRRDVDRMFQEGNSRVIQLRFHFVNTGNVPIEYFTEKLLLEKKSIKPPKVITTLFPNQDGSLYSNIYESKTSIGNGDGLKGSIKVIFWASETPEEKFYFQRDFILTPGINTIIRNEHFGSVENIYKQ